MPELPDLTVYLDCIEAKARGCALLDLAVASPFVLRTTSPRPQDFAGRALTGTSRIGKRLVLHFDGDAHAVIHLMILGRLQWRAAGGKAARGRALALFRFEPGTLALTESGTKRRASLHLVQGRDALAQFGRGGLEPLAATPDDFRAALTRTNMTVKRALTHAAVLAGIGNAYSDEILHRARLSPFRQTQALTAEECETLMRATQAVLREWTQRLRDEAAAADGWPQKVTAFRADMAVHGRYRQPCPVCGAPVQRIVYADNEANYCARCQTGGRMLADRALSRLLKDSWPKTLEEMEG